MMHNEVWIFLKWAQKRHNEVWIFLKRAQMRHNKARIFLKRAQMRHNKVRILNGSISEQSKDTLQDRPEEGREEDRFPCKNMRQKFCSGEEAKEALKETRRT
ncbi:hypothetical protein QQF64_026018 [Cirrhinus molitorella]|uniref:Uncharacterized protein n=1 Tax=Cirrhinus molitorella TaxID=172907 RepID=A0ABR3NQM5_9TELE